MARPDPAHVAALADGYRTRFVQPYEDRGPYLCPYCMRDIPRGTHHVVVVPDLAVDLRRHWHKGCWVKFEATLRR